MMRPSKLISAALLARGAFAQGMGCPESTNGLSVYSDEPSPFGWPLSPNDFVFSESGSAHWGDKYMLCNGKRQSPIDVTLNSNSCGVTSKGEDGLLKDAASYKPASMHPDIKVSSYMHTAFASGDFGELKLKDKEGHTVEYEAVQVHLTAPSMHTVDGQHHGAELIIFHKPKGAHDMLAESVAVSIFFDANESANSAIFNQMGFMTGNSIESQSWKAPHYIDLPAAVADAFTGASYMYQGSVPVPPCTENVKYFIMGKVQHASKVQIDKLDAAIKCFGGGSNKRHPLSNPYMGFCRDIFKNTIEVSHSDEYKLTCDEAAANHTTALSAVCWDDHLSEEDKEHCLTSPIDAFSQQAGTGSGELPVFNFKTVQEVEVSPSMYTLDAVSVEKGVPAAVGNFGNIMIHGRSFLIRKIAIKPISSHTYDGAHHAGELQIEAIMFGDEFGNASGVGAAAGHSTMGDDHSAGHRRLAGHEQEKHRVIVSVPLKLGTESVLLRQLGLPFEAYKQAIQDYHSYIVENTVDVKAGIQTALDGPWLWYSGGMTTPGCPSWGVRWLLLETPIEASIAQMNYLALKVSGMDSTRRHAHPMSATDYKKKVTSMSLPAAAIDATQTCDPLKHWDYSNPSCWAESFPTCATGHAQSPINIITSDISKTGTDNFLAAASYRPVSDLHIVNTGYFVGISNDQFGYIQMGGENGYPEFFTASSIQIHMPSEHMVDGRQFAAELQIIHKRQKYVSQLPDSLEAFPLVTASFFFDIGDSESNLLKQFFLGEGAIESGSFLTTPYAVDLLRSLGPALDGDFYRYDGSFTKPDCHEQNKWFIFDHVFSMSQEQWNTFKAMFPNPGNNRPIQDMHGRTVVKNSFEDYPIKKLDFYLGRDYGRDRFYPGEFMIAIPIIVVAVIASVTMLATFVREGKNKLSNSGGLAETTIGRQSYNRM
mmetsp:Transcript_34776/g.63298  ORF Transcript_34776/g.63298 Transcript_34776/m.63298 type:complete len:934 (+) Transcript_34776:72-2873(+)